MHGKIRRKFEQRNKVNVKVTPLRWIRSTSVLLWSQQFLQCTCQAGWQFGTSIISERNVAALPLILLNVKVRSDFSSEKLVFMDASCTADGEGDAKSPGISVSHAPLPPMHLATTQAPSEVLTPGSRICDDVSRDTAPARYSTLCKGRPIPKKEQC